MGAFKNIPVEKLKAIISDMHAFKNIPVGTWLRINYGRRSTKK